MKVSVIITSYNYAQYLTDAINSVLNQTFTDFELIIIDDNSTDNSADVIKSFTDSRIKFIQNETNLGLKSSMQKAISLAQGEWVAFLESDDSWKLDVLEKRLKIAKNYADVGIIFNDVEEFGDGNWILAVKNNFERTRKILSKKTFPKNIFKDINAHNLILTFSSVMIKRKHFDNLNFNTPIDALLDWWIYIHIAYDTQVFYIAEKLTNWRQHRKSYISRKARPHFRYANIEAYLDVFKTKKLGLKFLPFLVFSTFLMSIQRVKFYRVVLIRKIKDLLHLKKRPSPLFDED